MVFVGVGVLLPITSFATENSREFLSSFYRIDVFSPSPAVTDLFFSRDKEQAPLQLGVHKGEWVLLNIWATWCAPCVAELPSLNRLARRTDDGVDVLAVSVDRKMTADRIAYHLKRWRIEKIDPLHDTARILEDRLDTKHLPVTYLIGPDGNLRAAFYGRAKWESPAAQAFLRGVQEQPDFFRPYVNSGVQK